MDFIQVERIIKDGKGIQKVAPEVISISEIHTFRPWHHNENDTVKGDATLLVMKNSSRVTGQPGEKISDNLPTMVIHESFNNFIKRMSGRVIIIGDAK